MELAAAKMSEELKIERLDSVKIGHLEHGEELTVEPLAMTKGKMPVEPILEAAKKQQGGTRYVTGKFVKKSQSNFYMENQSVICVPEEGDLTVTSACCCVDSVQKAISAATGLCQSKVRVQIRRVGGAFGGEFNRPVIYAALVAQAALKFKLPVRLVLPQEIDMRICGGRQEIEMTWQAAVQHATGKVLAVD